MKYGLLLLLAMFLLWQWRHARRNTDHPSTHKKAAQPGVVDMLQCAGCGVHLPASEAIQGGAGVYCCVAHRQAQEA